MPGTMTDLATRFVLGETGGFANQLRMSDKLFRLQSTPSSGPITVVKTMLVDRVITTPPGHPLGRCDTMLSHTPAHRRTPSPRRDDYGRQHRNH